MASDKRFFLSVKLQSCNTRVTRSLTHSVTSRHVVRGSGYIGFGRGLAKRESVETKFCGIRAINETVVTLL